MVQSCNMIVLDKLFQKKKGGERNLVMDDKYNLKIM